MPAWSKDWTGLKTVVVKTDNAAQGLPTVQASYLLIDNATGETVAMMDGTELTRRRTAAASALWLPTIWPVPMPQPCCWWVPAPWAPILSAPMRRCGPSRTFSSTTAHMAKAEALCCRTWRPMASKFPPSPISKRPCAQADIVSCVTTSTAPIVKGAWLKPGTHVDLAGAFKPSMRETDGDVVARARVYVDTREGALSEAGDLLQARDEGKFDFAASAGRSLRPLPRHREGPRDRERNHPVQVLRHGPGRPCHRHHGVFALLRICG